MFCVWSPGSCPADTIEESVHRAKETGCTLINKYEGKLRRYEVRPSLLPGTMVIWGETQSTTRYHGDMRWDPCSLLPGTMVIWGETQSTTRYHGDMRWDPVYYPVPWWYEVRPSLLPGTMVIWGETQSTTRYHGHMRWDPVTCHHGDMRWDPVYPLPRLYEVRPSLPVTTAILGETQSTRYHGDIRWNPVYPVPRWY